MTVPEVATMNETQPVVMEHVEDTVEEEFDFLREYDLILAELEDTRLTAGQVVALKSKPVHWSCRVTGCEYRIPVKISDLEAVPFLIIRHLIKDHGMTPDEIMVFEPGLGQEVDDYCRTMGFGTPVIEQTGVPTKMGSPR